MGVRITIKSKETSSKLYLADHVKQLQLGRYTMYA